MAMIYRYVCPRIEGFIQQVSTAFVARGYLFYVSGIIPDWKDPLAVDRKLIERYETDLSPWQNYRRMKLGKAKVKYLRHRRFFSLFATKGEHRFFVDESKVFKDVRVSPFRFASYAVSLKAGKACVRIDREPKKSFGTSFWAKL